MQNDQRLPLGQKRNYSHAIDGIVKTVRYEGGPSALMKGVKANTTRAVLMTSSQLACYDLIKSCLLGSSYFTDGISTHFLSSLLAVRRTFQMWISSFPGRCSYNCMLAHRCHQDPYHGWGFWCYFWRGRNRLFHPPGGRACGVLQRMDPLIHSPWPPNSLDFCYPRTAQSLV